MKEQSYKLSIGGLSLTATCFLGELGDGRREPLGEIFDNLSNIHRHAEFEMFFIADGEMELVCENDNFHFSDSVVIMPPNMGHYTVIDAERVFVIYIDIEKAEGDAERELAKKLSSGVLSIDISYDERFYIEKLSLPRSLSDFPHLIYLLFSELFGRLVPTIANEKKGKEVSRKYAFALDEYIEHHYFEKICLSDLAASLHLCEKQISRVIKKEYGCSFTEYVNRKRISVAVMMLKHTEMTVSEIASAVGFENNNYFYRVFKQRYGMTPSEYRNSQKNGS